MKNLSKHLILATVLVFSTNIFSQSPTPPEPPKSESSSSYSVTVNNEDESIHIDSNSVTHSSSISETKSDDLYKFKASFDKSKTEQVKQVIMDKLGRDNFSSKISTYKWIKKEKSKNVFECTLTKGRVKIYLNTDEASSSFQHKIETLGEELKFVISGSSHKKGAEHAKRDLEHANQDLERAKRKVEQAKRRVEQAKKKN